MELLYTSMFEYGAILKGSQTFLFKIVPHLLFEYGAILKGSQTKKKHYYDYS